MRGIVLGVLNIYCIRTRLNEEGDYFSRTLCGCGGVGGCWISFKVVPFPRGTEIACMPPITTFHPPFF
jgi:hypothetical protein